MLVIDLTGPESKDKSLEELLDMHNVDISREIINVICEAIDKGVSRVTAVEIRTPEYVYSFTSTTTSYATTLEKNIPAMILTEEYEICAKAKKYIDKINNRKLLVDSNK